MERLLNNKKMIWLMLLPALAVFILYVPLPVIFTLILSISRWNLIEPLKFVGLRNYSFLVFKDPVFLKSIANTFIFVILSMAIQLPVAMALAYRIHRIKRSNWIRNIIFLPVMLSCVAVSLMFYFLLHPNMGLVNGIIRLFDRDFSFAWLGEPSTALLWVILSVAWQWVGYHMVLYMAGIGNVPQELIEAAQIDGASSREILFRIIIPQLMPVIQASVVLITTSSFKSFDQIFLMTGGGPNGSSEVLASLMYTKTFSQMQYGLGSSISVFIILLCVVSSFAINKVFNKHIGD